MNNISDKLWKDPKFQQKCMEIFNRTVLIEEESKPLKDFPQNVQRDFIYKCRLTSEDYQRQHTIKKQKIIEKANKRGDSYEALQEKAQSLSKLDLEWSRRTGDPGFIFTDDDTFAGIQYMLAQQTTVNLLISSERNKENADCRVKYTDSPIRTLDIKAMEDIASFCEDNFGAVIYDLININEEKHEIYIQFRNREGRDNCINRGEISWLGRPVPAPGIAWNTPTIYHAVVIAPVRKDTSTGQVSEAFADIDFNVTDVKIFDTSTYVYFATAGEADLALAIRNLRINKRVVNVHATKRNDTDELKVIVGFWNNTRTTHQKELYEIADAHGWKVLYFQAVFWKNNALKHYYFARFATIKDKHEAMFNPMQIEGNIIQAYEINRDSAGKLLMPKEGGYRKRFRDEHATEDEDNLDTLVPRSFN